MKPKPTQSKRRKLHPAISGFRCNQARERACAKITKRRKLANAIADTLFENDDDGNKIEYLVRFRPNGVSIGRWMQPAVAQRIEQLLNKHGI